MASASSLADALIATMKTQSASTFNTDNLTKLDFGLLDTTNSGCVFVVLPGGADYTPDAFGAPESQQANYAFTLKCYVREQGDSTLTLARVWQAEKDLAATLKKDDTLGGSAAQAYLKRASGWNGEAFVEVGGHIWVPQDFSIVAMVFDG